MPVRLPSLNQATHPKRPQVPSIPISKCVQPASEQQSEDEAERWHPVLPRGLQPVRTPVLPRPTHASTCHPPSSSRKAGVSSEFLYLPPSAVTLPDPWGSWAGPGAEVGLKLPSSLPFLPGSVRKPTGLTTRASAAPRTSATPSWSVSLPHASPTPRLAQLLEGYARQVPRGWVKVGWKAERRLHAGLVLTGFCGPSPGTL